MFSSIDTLSGLVFSKIHYFCFISALKQSSIITMMYEESCIQKVDVFAMFSFVLLLLHVDGNQTILVVSASVNFADLLRTS